MDDGIDDVVLLRERLHRIEPCGGYATSQERIDLVFHQGDEGRNDER